MHKNCCHSHKNKQPKFLMPAAVMEVCVEVGYGVVAGVMTACVVELLSAGDSWNLKGRNDNF